MWQSQIKPVEANRTLLQTPIPQSMIIIIILIMKMPLMRTLRRIKTTNKVIMRPTTITSRTVVHHGPTHYHVKLA